MQPGTFFHSVSATREAEQANANLRKFVGDGTPILVTPNLLTVNSVIVDGVQLPASIQEKYVEGPSGEKTEPVTVPMLVVQKDDNGDTVLLRSIKSNDGIWQNGSSILIDGTWSDEKKAKNVPATTTVTTPA